MSSLALAIDLAIGVPTQTVHRSTLIARRMARVAGLDAADVQVAYHLAILRFIGCSTTAHATSQYVDKLALGNLLAAMDDKIVPEIARAFGAVMPVAKARAMAQQMAASPGSPQFAQLHRTHCEAAELFAMRFGLGPVVVAGLAHVYERWDGLSTKAATALVEAVLTAAGQSGARTRRAAAIGLSDREIEVLQHVARGETNGAVANTLGLSAKTVERHVANIYNKLGISTRAGAAIYALESSLL